MGHILSLPSRGPVRIRKILQRVEPSLDHVRLPLTHLEASHPLQQPHLRRRAALLTPVWTRAQRTVRTTRLRLPLGDTEASVHLTPCMELGSSARTEGEAPEPRTCLS